MQPFLKIPFIRSRLYGRAVEKFLKDQEDMGVVLRNEEVVEGLCGLHTILVDAALIMEGYDEVRRIAAPLTICDFTKLKHQGSWMVLMAGVSLGCDGYAPLENLAREMSFDRERMLRQYPLMKTLPYDDERRVETTIHRDVSGYRAFAKGDPSAILSRCTMILDGRERQITELDYRTAMHTAREMEKEGIKTLAFATRLQDPQGGAYEEEMTFLGVLGMGDLPHKDSPWMMNAVRKAGVRPVLVAQEEMLPGAVQASGALRKGAAMCYAEELDALDDAALSLAAAQTDAYVGMDWQRRERLAKALSGEGIVATLSPEPHSGGMVLAFEGGTEPDVVFEEGGMRTLVRLLGECQELHEKYVGKPR